PLRQNELLSQSEGFRAIPGHAHDLQVWLQLNQLLEALTQQALVIHNQDPNSLGHGVFSSLAALAHVALPSHALCSSHGITTPTRQPGPGSGPAESRPPSSATRSRMPCRPKPGPDSLSSDIEPWPLSSTVSSTWPSGSPVVERRSSALVAWACLRILVS